MNQYIIKLIDESGYVVSEAAWSGYGPAHAVDEAIMTGVLFIPFGFMGTGHAVNSLGVAYKFDIGYAD